MSNIDQLEELKKILAPEHAVKKEFVIDKTLQASLQENGILLANDILNDVASSFGFSAAAEENALKITYASRADFHLDADKQELQLKGSATTVPALAKEKLPLQIIFTIDEQNNLNLVIAMKLVDNWQFQTGFPILNVLGNELTFPFDKITTKSACYIYSSQHAHLRVIPWPLSSIPANQQTSSGNPADPLGQEIKVEQRLNLAARVELRFLNEAYKAVVGADGYNISSFLFYGKISCDLARYPNPDSRYPYFNLISPLPLQTLKIDGKDIQIVSGAALHIGISSSDYGPPDCSASLVAQTADLDFGLRIQNTDDSALLFVQAKNANFNLSNVNGEDQKLPLFPTRDEIDKEGYILNELKNNNIFGGSQIGLRAFYLLLKYEQDQLKILKIGFSVGATTSDGWQLYPAADQQAPAQLILRNFALDVDAVRLASDSYAKSVSFSASAELLPSIFPGVFYFYIATAGSDGKWGLRQISGGYAGSVKLYDIWKGIAELNQISFDESQFPTVLKGITFSDFDVTLRKQNKNYSFSISGTIDATLPLQNTVLSCSLTVKIGLNQTSEKSFTLDVTGIFMAGQHEFNLELKFSTGKNKFILSADWHIDNTAPQGEYDQDGDEPDTDERNGYLQLSDIANTFGFYDVEIPDVFKTINISLKSAKVYYDYSENILLIACESATYGAATFIAANPKNPHTAHKTDGWRFFFGLDVGFAISLDDFELFKNLARGGEKFLEIKNIKVAVVSKPFSADLVDKANAILNEYCADTNDSRRYPKIPSDNGQGIGAGFGFAMDLVLGQDTTLHLTIGKLYADGSLVDPYSQILPDSLADSPGVTTPTIPAASANDVMNSGYWVKIEKAFGPFFIEKIGIEFDGSKITLMANMALAAAGVSIELIGFGAVIDFKNFSLEQKRFIPDFTLQGLSVSYSSGPLTISGGLIGKLKPELELIGKLVVKAGDFGISALAGYANHNGKPALFIYALLNAPLGGPPFFFVTGIAGGFGFNYQLITPTVDQISQFPLVQLATGTLAPPSSDKPTEQIRGMLSNLSNVLSPSVGQYWLAAGIQFTSFELAKSFALAIVKFGESLEIDLLGQTTIEIPPSIPGATSVLPPVISVTLQLLASFKPAEGFLGISGQLSNTSYILSENCHLTGGFAYYMWFSGPYRGDFVITMGGYKHGVAIPRHYPHVPRLGVNWQVLPLQTYEADATPESALPQLSLKGGLYFAVTSSIAMLGGSFSANWKSSAIQASFDLTVDFSVTYEPFYYHASAYIEVNVWAQIGSSRTGTGLTLSAKATGAVELWGPEFSGKINFRVGSITHEITFGGPKKEIAPVSWAEFVVRLLKIQTEQARAWLSSHPEIQKPPQDVLTNGSGIYVDVTKGLIAADQSSDVPFLVNGSTFEITVKTAIPTKEKISNFKELATLAPASNQPHRCETGLSGLTTGCAQPIILGAGELPSDKCRKPIEISPSENFGVGPVHWPKNAFFPRLVIAVTPADGRAGNEKKLNCVRILTNAPQSLWGDSAADAPMHPLLSTTICNVVTGYRIQPLLSAPIQFCSTLDTFQTLANQPTLRPIRWSRAYLPRQHVAFNDVEVESTIHEHDVKNERNLMLKAIQTKYENAFYSNASDADTVSVNTSDLDLLDKPVFRLLGACYETTPGQCTAP